MTKILPVVEAIVWDFHINASFTARPVIVDTRGPFLKKLLMNELLVFSSFAKI